MVLNKSNTIIATSVKLSEQSSFVGKVKEQIPYIMDKSIADYVVLITVIMIIVVADQMTIQMQLINVIVQTILGLPFTSSLRNKAKNQITNIIALTKTISGNQLLIIMN